jgi:hypothetical protein
MGYSPKCLEGEMVTNVLGGMRAFNASLIRLSTSPGESSEGYGPFLPKGRLHAAHPPGGPSLWSYIKQHQYLEFLEVLKRPDPRKRPRHGIRGSYCEIRNESRKPAAVAKATNRPPSR